MALSEFNTTSFIRQAIRNARKSLSDEKTMLTHIQGMEKEFSYVSSEDGQSSLHMHYPCSEDLLSQDKKIKSFGHRNKEKMNIGAQKLSSNNTTKIIGRTIVADNTIHDRKSGGITLNQKTTLTRTQTWKIKVLPCWTVSPMMNFASYPLQQKKNGWSSEVDDDFDFGSEPTPSLDIEGISNVQSGQSNDDITLNSLCSSIRSKDMQNTFLNGDMPPLSLLQLQGITVGNFNMACNCHIFAAQQIMIKYKIHIMAIKNIPLGTETYLKKKSIQFTGTVTIGTSLQP